MAHSIGVRVQRLDDVQRALIVARLAAGRSQDGEITAQDLGALYTSLGLPGPSTPSNAIASMVRRDFLRSGGAHRSWKLTPLGREMADSLVSAVDLAALEAEAAVARASSLGGTLHSVVPPSLAPPKLIAALREFLESHPFETNVFAMTRFPDSELADDPVASSIAVARDVCKSHGLEMHLASDRAIVDDLWSNVAAHMWASHYGIAFFEDRVGRGLNYNLTIEVGSMLMTGRRCALLKDSTVDKMPTDFVGHIYKDIDLDDVLSAQTAIHSWIRDDLSLGACERCPN